MAGKQDAATRDTPRRRLRTPHALPARTAAPTPDPEANLPCTDETRRSGRANKGHHRTRDALDEPATAQKPKGKAAKPGRKTATPAETPTQSVEPEAEEAEDEGEEEEEEETIYRCVCGVQREIGGRDMICCDNCDAWQHNICLNLPPSDIWGDKPYYCEQCKPQDHSDLLAAIERGEKPWARKKGAKSKPRASDVKPESHTPQPSSAPKPAASKPAVDATPTPTPKESSNGTAPPKACHPLALPAIHFHANHHRHQPEETPKSQPQSPLGEKRRRESIADKDSKTKKRRKSSQHQDKSAAKSADVASLPDKQRAIAEKLQETMVPLITEASNARGYSIPDAETAQSLATRFVLQICRAAVDHHGEPSGPDSPFALRLRAIMFNVKKNAFLVDRLLSGSLKADELATMATEEMASEDKQREYAAMREAAEKQLILTDETAPRMRKTHKGDELVDDENANDNTDFHAPQLRERETEDEDQSTRPRSSGRDGPSQTPVDAAHPLPVDTDSARRPSTNFDINSVFDKVRSPQNKQQAFIPRRQSSMQEKPQQSVDDADVDRLLKDEDNDVDMSGYSTDPTVCWQGSVTMQSMEPFDAVARFVAGGDFGQVVPWEKLLTKQVSIQGRIENAKGDDYIRGIARSESHEVAILAVSPVTSEGRSVFDHLYEYFHSRQRWGVVPIDAGNEIMRDLYIIPIEAGGSNLPPFIDMLEHCTIETPRKEHMLLLTLIAKLPEVKPQLPSTEHFERYPAQDVAINQIAQPAPPMVAQNGVPNGPSPSPVTMTNPHAPQYSPMAGNFPPAPYGNPYATPPMATAPPPQPQPAANAPAHHRIPKALELLGPYIDSPVVIQMLNSFSQNEQVAQRQMSSLRDIFDQVPEARENIQVLTQHLAQKSELQQQHAS
ncbi:zinc ion binding [Ascochyta rabiei]|uniref:Transcription factor BYE1 n=1 Tax=Didymella rabiei TaxID=5454 RepID=A0A163KUN3_DIDRA|nr:zinc ion binding [Ascochyta rabiei]